MSPSDIRVDSVRLLDPVLSKAISEIPLVVVGVPRDRIAVPISRAPEPTDANLYEDPAGAAVMYLPRYTLATQRVSGQEQYWASLASSGNRWAFTVCLAKSPDPRLGPAARDAQELKHDLSFLLRYTVPQSGNLQKELIFDEIEAKQGVVRTTLYLSSLPERDELFFVLTDRTTPAQLLARRSIRVGIPVPVPVTAPSVSSGTGTLRGTWIFDFNAGAEGAAGDVWWEQVDNTVRRLVPRGQAQLARLGAVDFDALTLDTLKQQPYSSQPVDGSLVVMPMVSPPTSLRVSFEGATPVVRPPVVRVPTNQLTPGTVLAVKTNAGSYAKVRILEYGYNLLIQWQTYAAGGGAAVPLFRETTRTLDDVIRLSFDRDLHRYVFADLTNVEGSGSHAGFKRWTVPWAGRDHSYYQETVRLHVFHYSPDAFKLARRPQSPHVPLLAFQIETSADSESPTVRLDYSAFRHQDEKRLQNAAIALSAKVPANMTPVFLPISVNGATFKLALPRGGAGGPFQERPGAAVSSSLGVADSLTGVPLADFASIWDAMADTTGNAVLFQGRIEFRVAGEEHEEIPFVGRLGDMAGDVFDVSYQPVDEASPVAGVKATIRNAIESPATLKGVVVQFSRDGTTVPGTVTTARVSGTDTPLNFPILLADGQTAELQVSAPLPPVPGSGPLVPVFDLTDVTVAPNLQQVLKVIALNQQPESSRRVTVATFAEVLSKAELREIRVEFERGQPITFPTANGEFQTTAKVRYPVLGVLGHSDTADQYRYRIVTHPRPRPEGEVQPDSMTGDWQTSTSDSFTVTSDLLPAKK